MRNSGSDDAFPEFCAECATHKTAFSNNSFSCSLHFTYAVRQLMFLSSMFPVLLLVLAVSRGIFRLTAEV